MNPLLVIVTALGLVTVPAVLGYGVMILADKARPRVKVMR